MRDWRRPLVAYVVVSMVAPALATAVGLWFQWSWRGELPSPVATHWAGSGPDGFGPAWHNALGTAGLGFVLPVLLAAIPLPSLVRGDMPAWKARFIAAACLWSSLFLVGLLTLSLEIQRGLVDAADAAGIGGVLAVSLLVASTMSIATAFLIPKCDPHSPG